MKSLSSFRKAIALCLFFNALASIAMLLILRQGVDSDIELLTRVRYLAENPVLWRLSWLLWIMAAISLIYFLVHWGVFLDSPAHRSKIIFGVIVACLGMVPDTLAETLYIGLLPKMATTILQTPESLRLPLLDNFVQWQWALTLMTGFLGNGFYCLGGFTLNCISLGVENFPKKIALIGFPVWIFALGLSVSTIGLWRDWMIVSTALTMGAFILWLLVLLIFLKERK